MNKDAEKQKMCKVGLSLGRNDLKVEGNFQIGYHSKTDKKYTEVDVVDGENLGLPTIQEENSPNLPTIQEEN